MAKTALKAKDCSPYGNQELCDKYLPKLLRKERDSQEKAKDGDFFVFSDRDHDTDDEAIVFCDRGGNWCAGRYIGKCRMEDGSEIEITPRFGKDFLLRLLEGIYNLKLRKSSSSTGGKDDKDLPSLIKLALYAIWTYKFAHANKYGLPRRVVKREYLGDKIKGHLNVRKSLKVMHTKQQVHSECHEREFDDKICKIVYHAYKVLEKISFMPASQTPQLVRESIQQLREHYHSADLTVLPHEYERIRYKGIYASWKPLVDFSWQVIQQQFGLRESTSRSYAVFIDMAEIWEQYLRKTLSNNFKGDGWRCWTVEETKQKIYGNQFYGGHIIPDIVLEKGDDLMVFDAKYKRMAGVKDDVDRCDLFQIHTYVAYFKARGKSVTLAGLLYPIETEGVSKDGGRPSIARYHSDSLFGLDGEDAGKTKFIVDGIVCHENDGCGMADAEVGSFIERLQELAPKTEP